MPQLYIFATTLTVGTHLWHALVQEHPLLADRFGRSLSRIHVDSAGRALQGRTLRAGDVLLAKDAVPWHMLPFGFLPPRFLPPGGIHSLVAVHSGGPWIYECMPELPDLTSVDAVVAFLLGDGNGR